MRGGGPLGGLLRAVAALRGAKKAMGFPSGGGEGLGGGSRLFSLGAGAQGEVAGGFAAIGHDEGLYFPIPVAGDEGISGEHCAEGDFAQGLGGHEELAGLVPDFGDFIPAAGDESAVCGEVHKFAASGVGGPFFSFFALRHIPQHEGAVLPGRGEEAGEKGERVDGAFVSREGDGFGAAGGFPDGDSTRPVCAGDVISFGGEGDGGDPIGVFFDRTQEGAVFGLVEFEDSAGASEYDGSVVGTEVCGEHLVDFVAEGGDALAVFDFPEGDLPGFSAGSAAAEEDLAVSGESEDGGESLGEGEGSEHLEGVGVEEEDLFLAADGGEGRPWACGQSHEGIGAGHWGEDHGLRETLGHGRRSGGPLEGDFGDGDGVGHGGPLAGERLGDSPGDPLFNEPHFVGGEPVTLRGHDRFFAALDATQEEAGGCISGLEDFTVVGACEGGGVGGEIEAGFLFIGVVTVEAGVLEEREDVVLVGDLVGELGGECRNCEGQEAEDSGFHGGR